MMQYRFYIGYTQQDGDLVTEQQKEEICKYLLGAYLGFTMYPTAGMWMDDGELQREQSVVFETVVIGTEGVPNPCDIAVELARIANQKSVLYTGVVLKDGGFSADAS